MWKEKLEKRSLIFGLIALSSLLSITSGARIARADETGVLAGSPLFQSDSILDVTLRTNLPDLIDDRTKSYHTASIEVVDPAVRGGGFKMKVSTRGMTSLRTCGFPHLRFKFDQESTQNTILRNLKKVKIVGHCDNSNLGDTHANEQKVVILQYMLYRMYNLLTDYSVKVRLARMHYVDTSGSMKTINRYAFFMEPEESIAQRHGARKEEREDLNPKGIPASQLNANYAGLTDMFQFLIGNGDWRLLRNNAINILNAIMISGNDIGYLAMPYDMDRGGMCNGSFAYHSIYSSGSTFPIVGDDVSTIRDIYVNNYQGRKLYKFAISKLREKREEIYALYDSMKSLIDSKYRNRTVGHLDRFYSAIGTREDAEINDPIPIDLELDLGVEP